MMGEEELEGHTYMRERTTYIKECCPFQEGEGPEKTWKHRQHMDVQRQGLPYKVPIRVAHGDKNGRGSSSLPFLRNIAGIITMLGKMRTLRTVWVTTNVSKRADQTLFVLLLLCSLVYRTIMNYKIHAFPFPNDLYLMSDLLLLLLLLIARCKTLWHHLFADIINRLNGLQLGCNCRYALCIAIGVIAPRLLYVIIYLFRIMYINMLYQVKAQPVM